MQRDQLVVIDDLKEMEVQKEKFSFKFRQVKAIKSQNCSLLIIDNQIISSFNEALKKHYNFKIII